MNDTKNILIIENDERLRVGLCDALLAEGFNVVTAVDGEDGFDRALIEDPDLLVLDIALPRMSGIMFLERLRGEPVHSDVPAIIITDSRTADLVWESISLHEREYVVRADWTMDRIVDLVKDTLEEAEAVL